MKIPYQHPKLYLSYESIFFSDLFLLSENNLTKDKFFFSEEELRISLTMNLDRRQQIKLCDIDNSF